MGTGDGDGVDSTVLATVGRQGRHELLSSTCLEEKETQIAGVDPRGNLDILKFQTRIVMWE